VTQIITFCAISQVLVIVKQAPKAFNFMQQHSCRKRETGQGNSAPALSCAAHSHSVSFTICSLNLASVGLLPGKGGINKGRAPFFTFGAPSNQSCKPVTSGLHVHFS